MSESVEKPTIKQRGICYLSRIPPFMKPQKMRFLLEQYGAINRVYLQPEDENARKRRKKAGGSKKVNYTEGWVEFEDKKIAKLVAATLNGTIIGGAKRNFFHDDLWTIKYVSGLKWDDLTAKLAYQQAMKKQKLRLELDQATRENKAYLEQVRQARVHERIKERREKKHRVDGEGTADSSTTAATATPAATAAAPSAVAAPGSAADISSAEALKAVKRAFKQRAPVAADRPPAITEEAARKLLGISADAPPPPMPSAAMAKQRAVTGADEGDAAAPQRRKRSRDTKA